MTHSNSHTLSITSSITSLEKPTCHLYYDLWGKSTGHEVAKYSGLQGTLTPVHAVLPSLDVEGIMMPSLLLPPLSHSSFPFFLRGFNSPSKSTAPSIWHPLSDWDNLLHHPPPPPPPPPHQHFLVCSSVGAAVLPNTPTPSPHAVQELHRSIYSLFAYHNLSRSRQAKEEIH